MILPQALEGNTLNKDIGFTATDLLTGTGYLEYSYLFVGIYTNSTIDDRVSWVNERFSV